MPPVAAAGRLTGPPMPPVAAAVLPHPPLLVPQLAGSAAPELEPLRAACRQALAAVVAAADLTIVVGDGPVWGVPEPSAMGSFHRYGAEVEVALPALAGLDLPGLPPPIRLTDLPLSLAVAAHLLADLTPPSRLFVATVPPSLGPGAAAAIGRTLTTAAQAWVAAGSSPTPAGHLGSLRAEATRPRPKLGPGARPVADAGLGAAADPGPSPSGPAGGGPHPGEVGLVVMGDLSACRTEDAPGTFRPEAAGFDASVAAAFRTAEPTRLLDLDPSQAADLLVAGRVPLQVLAGAFQDTPTPRVPEEGGSAPRGRVLEDGGSVPGPDGAEGPPTLRGQVLYEEAPYGVGYLVAVLTPP